MAARVIPPGQDSATAVVRAVQIKQIFDGKGLYIRLNELPDEANYRDSTTRKPYYTPFPKELPQVYLERLDGKWYYSRETVGQIQALHDRVFPFGADILTNILPINAGFTVFGLALWQLLGILLVLAACFILHTGVSLLFRLILRALTGGEYRWTWISKESVKKLARYLSILLVVWLARLLVPALMLPIRGSEFVNKSLDIISAVMLMLIAMVIVRILRLRAREMALKSATRMDEQLLPIVTRIVNIVIVTATIIYILNKMNVNVTALIAGLSIGGLALALAAQDSVKNLIGSVMIFFDKPFRINDYIIGSGFEGEVVEIGFRSTRLKTLDTAIISVPNGIIANMAITNNGVRIYRLFNMMLSVTYQTSPDKLDAFIEALRQLIIDHPKAVDQGYYVHLREFSDSAVRIMFRCYLDVPDFASELSIKEELYLTILRMAEERGIRFAYPTTTVRVEQDSP